MELSWLLGISHHIASLAFWSYGHGYVTNAPTIAEGSEYYPE